MRVTQVARIQLPGGKHLDCGGELYGPKVARYLVVGIVVCEDNAGRTVEAVVLLNPETDSLIIESRSLVEELLQDGEYRLTPKPKDPDRSLN